MYVDVFGAEKAGSFETAFQYHVSWYGLPSVPTARVSGCGRSIFS
jgi:hypothetical protein